INFGGNPAPGDEVTIGGRTYTFVTTLGTAANQIAIGATPEATRANLVAAINGGSGAGTRYSSSTIPHASVTAGGSVPNITLTAKQSGNINITVTTTSAVLTVANVTGGTSNWAKENIPIPQGNDANQGAAQVHADDEISLIKDNNDNIYFATETQRTVRPGASNGTAGITSSPQVLVYERPIGSGGTWTPHTVKFDQQSSNGDRKRPVVAIMDQTLFVFAIHQNQTDTSYWSAPLDTLNFTGP